MPDATLLAFDFGVKRIGVAIGDTLLGKAQALTTITAEDNATRFATIGELIGEWQPLQLVVGLPRTLDGGEHEMTARCQRFAHQLKGRFGLPVALVDERLSSAEAELRLSEAGVNWRARKQQLDALAAQIILQDYLDVQYQQTTQAA